MALTKVTSNVIADSAITAEKISNTVTLGGPKIANVQYADASFTVLDDTAANTAGTARLVINGEGFNSGVTVIVGTTVADSITRVSSTQLRANVTPQAASSYPIYVQNTDGGTAIRINGVTFSNTPVWGTAATLSNQAANTSFNVSISATSDSNVTYSNTTALPAGTSLLSNGYFYGTVTIGAETVYTFDVKANDAENQDNTRTFSLTVTVGPPSGQLWAWGSNVLGELGFNDKINRSSPVQLGSSTDWTDIGQTRNNSTFALKSDNTLWLWGLNNYGQLGLNDRIHRSSPVQVGASTNWSKIDSDNIYAAAIKTDGTLWTWGAGYQGGLGLNDTTHRSSPTQVGSSTDWSKISCSSSIKIAIKTNGTLWAIGGWNLFGTIGDNTTIDKSSPVQIGSNTDWYEVTGGHLAFLAKKTNGTLWSWGNNNHGQLGLNDRTYKSSPTQVGSSTDWNLISGGFYSSFSTKTNNSLWAWGINHFGILGLNDTIYRSSPTQVGSSTNWSNIKCGTNHSLGIKTDGTLWLWGRNHYGQLGLGDTINKSSPVQLGSGTDWKIIGKLYHSTIAIK